MIEKLKFSVTWVNVHVRLLFFIARCLIIIRHLQIFVPAVSVRIILHDHTMKVKHLTHTNVKKQHGSALLYSNIDL